LSILLSFEMSCLFFGIKAILMKRQYKRREQNSNINTCLVVNWATDRAVFY
jgi:hypothetical protein